MRYNATVDWNLTERLRQSLPPDEWALLTAIADAAKGLGLPLYIVGGLPRDLILGRPSTDFDLVVEGHAGVLARRMAKLYGGQVTLHERFGTAKWDLSEAQLQIHEAEWQRPSLDFVSARSETYKHTAALPSVSPGTIADDLRRRDFSINALAIRLDGAHFGELRDDLGGLEDLRHGIVRALHEGSFHDDPTRMYRAVRYEKRYGFRIADETLVLMPAARALVEKLSAQRIRHELDMILDEQNAAEMLERLVALDLLRPIHPDLSYDREAGIRLSRLRGRPRFDIPEWPRSELRWLLWLMVLSTGQINSINARLHFTARVQSSLIAASQLDAQLARLGAARPSQWVEVLDEVPLIAAYATYLNASGPIEAALGRYLANWRHVRPKTTGHDLKALGLQPGPEYASVLRELRRARLDGKVNSEQEEQEMLLALLERTGRKAIG